MNPLNIQYILEYEIQPYCNKATQLFFNGDKEEAKNILLKQVEKMLMYYSYHADKSYALTGGESFGLNYYTEVKTKTQTIIPGPRIHPAARELLTKAYERVNTILIPDAWVKGNLKIILDGGPGEVGFVNRLFTPLLKINDDSLIIIPKEFAYSIDNQLNAEKALRFINKTNEESRFGSIGHTHPDNVLFSSLDINIISLIPNNAQFLFYGTRNNNEVLSGLLYYPFNINEVQVKIISEEEFTRHNLEFIEQLINGNPKDKIVTELMKKITE